MKKFDWFAFLVIACLSIFTLLYGWGRIKSELIIILIILIFIVGFSGPLRIGLLGFLTDKKPKHPKKQFIGLSMSIIGIFISLESVYVNNYILFIPGLFLFVFGIIIMKWARTGF